MSEVNTLDQQLAALPLPSKFQPGQEVDVDFKNSKYLKGCTVEFVNFSPTGKIFYTLVVPVGFEDRTVQLGWLDEDLLLDPSIKAGSGE